MKAVRRPFVPIEKRFMQGWPPSRSLIGLGAAFALDGPGF
jgi:hypothetical protein